MSLIRLGYGRYRDPMTGEPVEVRVDPIPDPIPTIPAGVSPSYANRQKASQKVTDEELLEALGASDGSATEAARRLGISRSTVRLRLAAIRDRQGVIE